MPSPFAHRVRVRASGLLLDEPTGGLLLIRHRALRGDGDFWAPPGGGVEAGETVHQTLAREFREETGLPITIGPLRHLHEYFDPPWQALELFFEVATVPGSLIQPRLGTDPELPPHEQLMQELAYCSLGQLRALPPASLHPILRNLNSWTDLMRPSTRWAE